MMALELKSVMQRHEDPWEWTVDQVARELVRITNDGAVGDTILLNRIDGQSLLTIVTRENLKDEVGITAFGTRGAIMRQVEVWRRKSQKYLEYVEDQDKKRMKDRLRTMVQDHQLMQQFKCLIAGPHDQERTIAGVVPRKDDSMPEYRRKGTMAARMRSLSPLPDLGSMELDEEQYKCCDAAPIREKERSSTSVLDGGNDLDFLGENTVMHDENQTTAVDKVNLTIVGDDYTTTVQADRISPLPNQVSTPADEIPDAADKTATHQTTPVLSSPTSDRDKPILGQSVPRRPTEHARKKPAGGYLGPHALLVDDLFYSDRDLDAEDSDVGEDTFNIPPSNVPAGTRRYAEKQLRHFFMSPEQTSIRKPGGLYRAALKPYRASLLRKHYKQSMTVFDVRGDKCKTYKAVVDDMDDLQWTPLDRQMKRNDSQKMIFGDDPESATHPKYNYNPNDNSEHSYDYLLKWMRIDDDKALPEFGDSGSEGEYDVQTWKEIEEEEGGPLPKLPSLKPLEIKKLDKGKKPARSSRDREQIRSDPEESGEELELSDVDPDLTPARELQENRREKSPVILDDMMDLDGSSPRNVEAEAEGDREAKDKISLVTRDANKSIVTNSTRNPHAPPDVIDLTNIDDEDETPRLPKKRRMNNRPEGEDRRQLPERERKRTKRFPEKEDPVFEFSDDNNDYNDQKVATRMRGRISSIAEDITAKASRDNVHRLVRSRARRIQLEEAKWKGNGGLAPEFKGKVQINLGKYASEDHIFIHPEIAEALKPHQIKGIRFLWGELVQGKRNKGALLAHTMGLGKTFQIIAFLHTVAVAGASPEPRVYKQIPEHMRVSRSLVICPAGLVDNWWDEFHNWLPMDKQTRLLDLSHIGNIHKIDSSNNTNTRIRIIRSWYENGGVLIMSYHIVRDMVRKFTIEDDPTLQSANVGQMLLEGPNIIVADEAHTMKNSKAIITKLAQQFKSTSRVALTGSPLSNNLIEYWTMIEWIDQGYLGPEREFQCNYVKPIYDGLWIDSTRAEKRLSLKKLRVLKKILEPKVERADITAIQNFLPSKTEFLITIPLTEIQMLMYQTLLQDIKDKEYKHFDAMHLLSLVNNHPQTVVMTLDKRNTRNQEEDAELEPASVDAIMPTLHSAKLVMESLKNAKSRVHSYRIQALRHILKFSIDAGDKVLVFTHSISTLDLLEWYLKHWNISLLRLDGSSDVTKRQQTTKNFNSHGDADVFIISTKAGGLGLNLFGANRVVIFDFRWTPMWEQQAVGRAYRIGQKKPVFVYRFIAGGTYEDRLRNMVDFKQQLQVRVIDQKDPRRSSTKLGTLLLKPPVEPPQEDLEEFRGKDRVLDQLLKKVDFIRDISYTQTFIPDDEDDLDEQEKADADAELQQLQLLREGGVVTAGATVSSTMVRESGAGGSMTGPVGANQSRQILGDTTVLEGEDISLLRQHIQQSAVAPAAYLPTVGALQQHVRYATFSSAPSAATTGTFTTPISKRVATTVPSSAPSAKPQRPPVTPTISTSTVRPLTVPSKRSSIGSGPATGPSRLPFEYDDDSDEQMSSNNDGGREVGLSGGSVDDGGDSKKCTLGLKSSTLSNQTESAALHTATRASERNEVAQTVTDRNEPAETEPASEAATEVSEDVRVPERGLLCLTGNQDVVLGILDRSTTPTKPPALEAVPNIINTAASASVASRPSNSSAPPIDFGLAVEEGVPRPPRVARVARVARIRAPFRESPGEDSTMEGDSAAESPSPAREAPPGYKPHPPQELPIQKVPIQESLVQESPIQTSLAQDLFPVSGNFSHFRDSSVVGDSSTREPPFSESLTSEFLISEPPIKNSPIKGSSTRESTYRESVMIDLSSSDRDSSSSPPSPSPSPSSSSSSSSQSSLSRLSSRAVIPPPGRRITVSWEEAARLQRLAQAPPASRRASRLRNRKSQRTENQTEVNTEELSRKQQRNREKKRRKKMKKQLLKERAIQKAALEEKFRQDAGDKQMKDIDVNPRPEGQGKDKAKQVNGEGAGLSEDRKLTAHEKVKLWKLENGKVPVGRYQAPAVKNRKK